VNARYLFGMSQIQFIEAGANRDAVLVQHRSHRAIA